MTPTPPSRCATCAFTPGTEANRCQLTAMKAKVCVHALIPFYCHENIDQHTLKPAPGEKLRLCIGWVDAMDVLHARGHYDRLPAWQVRVSEEILGFIARAENGEDFNERELFDRIASIGEELGLTDEEAAAIRRGEIPTNQRRTA